MFSGRPRTALALLSVVCVVLGSVSVSGAAEDAVAETTQLQRRDAVPVVETIHGAHPRFAPRAGSLREQVLARRARFAGGPGGPRTGRRIDGTMTTTYEAPTPADVRAVVDAAVEAWDNSLALSDAAPLEISVLWTGLGTRLLGQAGTEGEYRDADQFPTDRWYPAALANQLANADINGPETPEILIELNSALGDDWYVGVEGTPEFGQIDLYSVVLHEIAHGLGFLGSASASRDGEVTVNFDPPTIYDDLVADAAGNRLVDLPVADAVAALSSDGLKIDIGAGRYMPLSSPNPFVTGSSYSHFDENIAESQPGAMMTPALKNSEVQRSIDSTVLGVLDRIGWGLDTALLTPTLGDVDVRSGSLDITFTENWGERGALADSYVVSATALTSSGELPGPVRRVVPASSAPSVRLEGLQNGTSYELAVVGVRANHPDSPAATATVLLPPNPNKVRDLTVVGEADLTLRWSQPVASGEPITAYEVQYRRAASSEWSTSTSRDARWSGSLPPGRYWFRVRAQNEVGEGLWNETPMVGLSDTLIRPMPLDGQLARLYQAYFRRPADSDGMVYWRSIRAGGAGLGVVSDSFERSAEFVATYGSLTDEEFVERLYANVLDRSPDSDGRDYWLGVLADGADRGRVVLQFSESPEFVAKTGTVAPQSALAGAVERLHIALLRRAPTAPELAALTDAAQQSSLPAVAQTLLSSDQFSESFEDAERVEVLAAIHQATASTLDLAVLEQRLDDGDTMASIAVELTATPAFIISTGTGV